MWPSKSHWASIRRPAGKTERGSIGSVSCPSSCATCWGGSKTYRYLQLCGMRHACMVKTRGPASGSDEGDMEEKKKKKKKKRVDPSCCVLVLVVVTLKQLQGLSQLTQRRQPVDSRPPWPDVNQSLFLRNMSHCRPQVGAHVPRQRGTDHAVGTSQSTPSPIKARWVRKLTSSASFAKHDA